MNLWSVSESDRHSGDEVIGVAFWAWGSDEAVEAFWQRWECYAGKGNREAEYSVFRIDTYREPAESEPHEEVRSAVLRDAGFSCDGDDCCDCCGLHSMNGEFPVCPECRNCEECGCDCPEECDGDE